MPDAPRAREIVFVLAMSVGPRVHARVGGLAAADDQGRRRPALNAAHPPPPAAAGPDPRPARSRTPPSAWSSSPCPPAATSPAPPLAVALTGARRRPRPAPPRARARACSSSTARASRPASTSWIAALVLLGLDRLRLLGQPRPARKPAAARRLDRSSGSASASPASSSATSGARSNPWTGPAATLRRRLGRTGGIGLARLGAWPAALGLLAFAWFEIVSLAPADPAVLARAALGYWLVILAARRARGRGLARARRGLHRSTSASSPASPRSGASTAGDRVRLMAGPPGAQVLAMPPARPRRAPPSSR